MRKNSEGYTVIVAILIMGFLLLLTGGVFHLVLSSLKDNRGLWNNIKTSAAAEWAVELALMQIKEKGYGVYEKVEFLDGKSTVFGEKMEIAYDMGSKTGDTGFLVLEPGEHQFFPMFYIETDGALKQTESITKLDVSNGIDNSLVWNFIGSNWGISGVWIIASGLTEWKGRKQDGTFDRSSVDAFLSEPGNTVYLLLFNAGANPIEYTLTSNQDFSLPAANIIASAKIGSYKQNLRTKFDNTAFLNLLKFSIYDTSQ